jgi:hypothetical protein
MEQAIWIAFGAVMAFVMLGIVVNIISTQTAGTSLDDYAYVLDMMKNQCEFVCDSPIDTQLGQEIDMFAGGILKTDGQQICLYAISEDGESSQEDVSCRMCPCEMTNSGGGDVILDLTHPVVWDIFREHEYTCSFRKINDGDIQVGCMG